MKPASGLRGKAAVVVMVAVAADMVAAAVAAAAAEVMAVAAVGMAVVVVDMAAAADTATATVVRAATKGPPNFSFGPSRVNLLPTRPSRQRNASGWRCSVLPHVRSEQAGRLLYEKTEDEQARRLLYGQ